MSEKLMWQYLKNGLGRVAEERGAEIDLQRHEDVLSPGVPDVSFGLAEDINGWIELKQVPKWNHESTGAQVVVPWRPGQREWLMRRGKAGGHCWLLLRIGSGAKNSEYFLVPHNKLPERKKPVGCGQLLKDSAFNWLHGQAIFNILYRELLR